MKSIFLSCAILAASILPAVAQEFKTTIKSGEFLICDFRKQRGSLILPKIGFFVDEKANKVEIIDGHILALGPDAIAGQLDVRGNRALIINWTLTNMKFRGGASATIEYSAHLNRSTKKMQVTANVQRSLNRNTETGTCAAEKFG